MPFKADNLGVVVECNALVAVNPLDEGIQQSLRVWSLCCPVQVAQIPAQAVGLFHQVDVIALVSNG
jgi:hypothetical protein